MLKNGLMKGVLAAALLMCATVASAQDLGKQTVNFTLGYFTPLGFDSRDIDDVLIANSTFLQTRGRSFLDLDEFNGASVGGDRSAAVGRFDLGLAAQRVLPRHLAAGVEDRTLVDP